jgi:AcrR family transcriptional regulator
MRSKEPKQARAKATVASMFEGLLSLMERGDSDPGIQAIAARAGVSVGSVYQYFPSKRALTSRLLTYYVEKRATQLDADLKAARGLSANDACTQLVDAVLGKTRKRTTMDRAVALYVLRHGNIEALVALDTRMVKSIEAFLLEFEVDVPAPEIAAFLILNTLRTAVPLATVQRPEWLESNTLRNELVRLLTRYLGHR